jgi:hypothetical protein
MAKSGRKGPQWKCRDPERERFAKQLAGWCQLWCQRRGFGGITGDRRANKISNLTCCFT